MQVGELFLALGLIVEDKEWNLGQAVINKMANEMKRLAINAVTATMDVKKAMDVIGLPAVTAKTNLEKIAESGTHVTSAFTKMAIAAAGFFAINGLKGMVMDVVDFGSKVNDTAQATGITAENLQRWGYAAKQNSATMDQVADGSKKLARGLDEMFNSKTPGETPLGQALHSLGISMDDPAVKSRDLNGIMFEVSNKFSTMEDGGKKTAIAMQLFGRSGADLIPTLNSGVQGLMAYSKEAEDLGFIMSGKTTSALDDLGDNIDRLKAAWEGVKQQAIVALLPLLQSTVTSILEWAKANREVIASRIAETIGSLVTVLKALGKVVLFAIDHWRLLAALFAGGAIISGMMGIVKAIIFFQSAQAAAAGEAIIAWAEILGPILLVAAAIVGLGALAYKFREQIFDAFGKVGEFFKTLGGGIVDGLKSAFEFIAELPVIAELIWLVKKLDDLTGLSKSMSTEHEKALEDEVNNPGSFRKAHPDAGTFFQGDQSFDALNPGYMGATSSTGPAGAPVSARTAGGNVGSVVNSYSVVVHAGNADAKQTAELVDQKLREHDEKTRRQTAASLGV